MPAMNDSQETFEMPDFHRDVPSGSGQGHPKSKTKWMARHGSDMGESQTVTVDDHDWEPDPHQYALNSLVCHPFSSESSCVTPSVMRFGVQGYQAGTTGHPNANMHFVDTHIYIHTYGHYLMFFFAECISSFLELQTLDLNSHRARHI